MKNPKITLDEIGIIKKAQAGDQAAFSKLFNKYKSFVENILFGYLKDVDEAKDVANIVFVKVYNNLSSFKAYDSFGGWLRIMTNRTAIDYLRRINEKVSISTDSIDRLSMNASESSLEDELVTHTTYEQILDEIKSFSEKDKQIFYLFYVHGFTVEQISKKLQLPSGTIKSILSRRRKYLKQKFNLLKQ